MLEKIKRRMSKSSFQQVVPFKGNSMAPLIKEGDQVVVDLFTKPELFNKNLAGEICFYNVYM